MKTYRLITTKTSVAISIIVMMTIFLLDYFFNLKSDHSLYQNLFLILSLFSFFLFGAISIGLYYGIKLQDNIGKLTNYIDLNKLPDMSGVSIPDAVGLDEGIIGFLLAILTALIFILLAYIFALLGWFLLILFAAMLYWIYFRALRLVFKNSSKCKNDWNASLKIGLRYSLMYTAWIYIVVYGIHIIKS